MKLSMFLTGPIFDLLGTTLLESWNTWIVEAFLECY